MRDFKKEYYEQENFWSRDYTKIPTEMEKLQEIINVIRPDVQSILDVGCGNGFLVNTLVGMFPDRFNRVVGLDSSKEALKYLKTEKVIGSITDLPFENGSFDSVISSEVLEHLPYDNFKKGISELQRVSKKYLIITVPNNQNLEASLVMCPKCYCWFNPYYHIRSFDKNNLCDLFNSFKPIKIAEIGPIEKFLSYNHSLRIIYRTLRKPLPIETAICPQCGYQYKKKSNNIRNNNGAAKFLFKILSLLRSLVKLFLPIKKKKRWLLAFYKKEVR